MKYQNANIFTANNVNYASRWKLTPNADHWFDPNPSFWESVTLDHQDTVIQALRQSRLDKIINKAKTVMLELTVGEDEMDMLVISYVRKDGITVLDHIFSMREERESVFKTLVDSLTP